MATLADLTSRLRVEVGDLSKTFLETFTGNGFDKRFQLTEAPVNGTTMLIKVNNVDVSSVATVEEVQGIVTLAIVPANGAVIVMSGMTYKYFTDAELATYINTAFLQHSRVSTDSTGNAVSLKTLSGVEEYPLLILASTMALYTLATDAAFDIDIISPDGVSIPRSERFRQLSETIALRKEQYRELCMLLGIGLHNIEMGTLRRVSRMTNRYIPIYINQEIEDTRYPERVFPPRALMGRTPPKSDIDSYDIVLIQGDSWTATIDFPFDLTGYVAEAQIRRYPNSKGVYTSFNVVYTDRVNGIITLSLDQDQTRFLPVTAFWDLELTRTADPDYEETFVKGTITTSSQVTD